MGKVIKLWKNGAKRDRFIDHCTPYLIYLETGKYHEKYEWYMKNIWNRYCVIRYREAHMMPVYLSEFVIRLWKDLWRVYIFKLISRKSINHKYYIYVYTDYKEFIFLFNYL